MPNIASLTGVTERHKAKLLPSQNSHTVKQHTSTGLNAAETQKIQP